MHLKKRLNVIEPPSCFSKRQARNVSRQSAGQNHAPAHNKPEEPNDPALYMERAPIKREEMKKRSIKRCSRSQTLIGIESFAFY